MIKFFRKIRQKLLVESRFRKYVLYAIGEILLIVTGILFALYLNNLNSKKNNQNTEVKTLKEIKSNLVSSKFAFERTIEAEKNYLNANELILFYLDNNLAYDTILDRSFVHYFWTISTNPVKGGYEFLKSKGVDLISNDSLRKNISFMFESEFAIIKNENEIWANNLQQNLSYPYHIELFRSYHRINKDSVEVQYAKPFDYESLLEDNKFKSINTEIIINRKWNIDSLESVIKKIEELILQIEEEVQRLSTK